MTDADDVAFDGAPSGETPKVPDDDYCERCGVWLGKGSAFVRGAIWDKVCDECEEDDVADVPAEVPRPVRGIPTAISEALDGFGVASHRYGERQDPERAAEVNEAARELRAAILSALPREEPQPAPLDELTALSQKMGLYNSEPAPSGQALEALERLERHHDAMCSGSGPEEKVYADFALVRRALSGLPQEPTPEAVEAAANTLSQAFADQPQLTSLLQQIYAYSRRDMADVWGYVLRAAYRAQFGSPPSPPTPTVEVPDAPR